MKINTFWTDKVDDLLVLLIVNEFCCGIKVDLVLFLGYIMFDVDGKKSLRLYE